MTRCYVFYKNSQSVHNKLQLFMSELSTVQIFLCTNMTITAIKNFVSRKCTLSVHSKVDGKCGHCRYDRKYSSR